MQFHLPCAGWRWQPGQGVILNFANGIVWSKPIATNITGVPVTIGVLDSNGNSRTIGTTISNGDGTFDFNWTPDILGSLYCHSNI